MRGRMANQNLAIFHLILLVSVVRSSGPYDDEEVWPASGSGAGHSPESPDTDSPFSTKPPTLYKRPGPSRTFYVAMGLTVMSVVLVAAFTVVVIKLVTRKRYQAHHIRPAQPTTEMESDHIYVEIGVQNSLKKPVPGEYLTPVHGDRCGGKDTHYTYI